MLTYEASQGWVQRGADISVSFANGDILGARATSTGQVSVYKNGVLQATRDVTAWPYYDDGGYIGVWFVNAGSAYGDDFGGGSMPGGSLMGVHVKASLVKISHEKAYHKAQLLQVPPAGQVWKSYYFAGSVRIAMRVQVNGEADQVYYFLTDHLGSTAITVNENGSKQAEIRYKPWGETRYTDGNTPTDYLYTGQRTETGIGLYYYQSRFFDPNLGRFIQADTIVPDAFISADFDRYGYVRSNPVRYNDSSGHCLGPLAEICAHIALQLIVDLISSDLLDGSFDTPSYVRTAVSTTSSVVTNNPFSNYRDLNLPQAIYAQAGSQSPDITNWLVSTMNRNASGTIAGLLKELNSGNAADHVTALIAWTALVKGEGPWDYKRDFERKGVKYVTLGGVSFYMDVVANIHYGFVGAASGFDLEILLWGGGAAQVMVRHSSWGWWGSRFDQPEDANAIILGYQLFEQYGADLTVEQFMKAIQQNQNKLNKGLPQPK